MNLNEVAALRQGAQELELTLTDDQLEQMLKYLHAMLAENVHINVTAIRDSAAAITFHLLDSLTVVRWWYAMGNKMPPRAVLDLGTGGGFPAVPLAIAWPETQVTAIDGTGKKIGVVERCAALAGVMNVVARHVRGSELAGQDRKSAGRFELVTARAVGYSAKLLREVFPLVAKRGWVCLMKGPLPPAEEIRAAERFCEQKVVTMLPPYETHVSGLEARTILGFRR